MIYYTCKQDNNKNKGEIKMKKEQLMELLQAGKEVYATTYETEKEIAKALGIEESQVEYLQQYDDEAFEYNDREFVDGDMIYLINTPETRANEILVTLKNNQVEMNDDEIVAFEEEYMELTGEDEVRY